MLGIPDPTEILRQRRWRAALGPERRGEEKSNEKKRKSAAHVADYGSGGGEGISCQLPGRGSNQFRLNWKLETDNLATLTDTAAARRWAATRV